VGLVAGDWLVQVVGVAADETPEVTATVAIAVPAVANAKETRRTNRTQRRGVRAIRCGDGIGSSLDSLVFLIAALPGSVTSTIEAANRPTLMRQERDRVDFIQTCWCPTKWSWNWPEPSREGHPVRGSNGCADGSSDAGQAPRDAADTTHPVAEPCIAERHVDPHWNVAGDQVTQDLRADPKKLLSRPTILQSARAPRPPALRLCSRGPQGPSRLQRPQ
jgi:hypothetical protein